MYIHQQGIRLGVAVLVMLMVGPRGALAQGGAAIGSAPRAVPAARPVLCSLWNPRCSKWVDSCSRWPSASKRAP
jgi:hypothetical protein